MAEEKLGYLLILRIPMVKFMEFRNVMLRNIPILSNYHGHLLGVSDDVKVASNSVGYWNGSYVLALFEFDTEDNATRWFHSDGDVKQPDFQDKVDAILLPAFRAIPRDKCFINLSNYSIRDRYKFSQFLEENEKVMISHGGDSCVVKGEPPKKLRGLWDPSHVVVSHFVCKDDYQKHVDSDDYSSVQGKKNFCSLSDDVTFYLVSIQDWQIVSYYT